MIDPSDILNIVTDLLIRYSFQVIAAVVILIAGVLCARIVGRFIERSLQKSTIEKHLQQLLVRAAKVVVLLFTAILAMDKFGVQVTALVAGLSVAGVGVGFALQGVLGNIAAGLSIMFSKVFRIGDYIEIGNVRGQVQAVNLTSTILRTLEDARVIVPNRKIVGEIIYNYTGERRVTLTVEVSYQGDLDLALRTAREVLAENSRVLKTSEPQVGIVSLADSGVRITLRPWCKAEDYWQVQYEVYRAILDRFRERKIEIPYPTREVRILGQTS
jgi:small conductance mechanosensitive channel